MAKKSKTTDIRTLCLTNNNGIMTEKETVYEFSNGRKFKQRPDHNPFAEYEALVEAQQNGGGDE